MRLDDGVTVAVLDCNKICSSDVGLQGHALGLRCFKWWMMSSERRIMMLDFGASRMQLADVSATHTPELVHA